MEKKLRELGVEKKRPGRKIEYNDEAHRKQREADRRYHTRKMVKALFELAEENCTSYESGKCHIHESDCEPENCEILSKILEEKEEGK